MKKHVFFHRLLIAIISVSMIITFTSCTQQKKPIPKPSSKQQENKPPKELDELSKAVEKIEKSLSDLYERNKKPLFIQQEEVKKEQEKEKKKEDQGGQEQGGGSDSGSGGQSPSSGGSGGQQGQGQQPSAVELVTPEDKLLQFKFENQQMQVEVERANMQKLEQLKKDALELHSLWNAFEAKAVSQFVMQSSIIDFEDALNNLTKSIEGNNILQSLFDVTQLYKYLPDFYMVYTAESPPEIGKIRFAAKKIHLLGEKGDFAGAKETLEYLTGVWMLTRPRLNQESIDMLNQFEFAASDLGNAIDAKNPMIIKAKTEVLLKVADEIEKAGKKKEEK